ncbi:hypothetical protein JW935_25205 [candidate division KSB1 bacterium]|nr:hypothetical protein [candidate division KSB1 bacterium]
MKSQKLNLYFGLVVILIGMTALLFNVRIIEFNFEFFVAIVLLFVGYFLVRSYQTNKSIGHLIPSIICLLFALMLLTRVFLDIPVGVLWASLFWCGTISFGLVYQRNNNNWWAIIPAGVLFTLGTTIITSVYDLLDNDMEVVVLFLGFGLTFFTLWSIRNTENKLNWAIFPAIAQLLLTFFLFFNSWPGLNRRWIFPAVFIAMGIILIFISLKNMNKTKKNEKNGITEKSS